MVCAICNLSACDYDEKSQIHNPFFAVVPFSILCFCVVRMYKGKNSNEYHKGKLIFFKNYVIFSNEMKVKFYVFGGNCIETISKQKSILKRFDHW